MSETLLECLAADEESTLELAGSLARACAPGDCILLTGDLGAGKTTFARGFIQTLSPESTEIVSPTFTLLQTYIAADGTPISHFDLYRIEDEAELREIGLDEALESAISIMEWPEIARSHVPAGALDVTIRIGEGEDRHFTFAGLAPVWEHRLKDIL